MIIKEIEGDIIKTLLDNRDYYHGMIHGANCYHTMGAGLAKQVRNNFLCAYHADLNTVKGVEEKVGLYSIGYFLDGEQEEPLYIINAYTQFKTGEDARYAAVKEAFQSLDMAFGNGCTFLIPTIGCGIGGLDWGMTKQLINEATPNLDLVLIRNVIFDNPDMPRKP